MPSYLSLDQAGHSMPIINSRYKSLELENKQLEQTLKEKQQSLTLQLNCFRSQSNDSPKDIPLLIIEQLLQKQGQIRSFFMEKLIQRQIKIEQAKQMNEVINNYQKRVVDLRGVLINKEGEISALTFQFLRGTITRRQNLQAINCETLEMITLTKYAKERKKLLVEVEALEYTFNGQNKNRQRTKRRSQSRQKYYGNKNEMALRKGSRAKELKLEDQHINPISCKRPKDLLADKVIKLIQQQAAKFEEQQNLVEKLRLQLQQVELQQQKNMNKYKRSSQQRSKMLLKEGQDYNKDSKQLSFIKELQQQMSNTNYEVINSQLFSSIDTNKIKTQHQVSKSFKNNATATSLTEKRRRTLKEN